MALSTVPRRRRGQRGATTAEYVGIMAFVALLVVGVIGFVTPVGEAAKGIATKAYCQIGSAIGSTSGCSEADLPGYVPDSCTLSSNASSHGGSVSVFATVSGDTGYTILRVRERQPDGSFKDKYVVKTNGKLSGSYKFGPKAGAEVDTGSGGAAAKGGATVDISGNINGGQIYEFDNAAEAQKFAEDNKNRFGGVFGEAGGKEADGYYVQAGAGVGVSGEVGPSELKANGSVVLGVEHNNKTGANTFNMALTATGAAKLGIPVPESLLQAQANGEVNFTVLAAVTMNSKGEVTGVKGSISGNIQGSAGVGVDPKAGTKDIPKEQIPNGTVTGLDFPMQAVIKGGGQFTLDFTSSFVDADGNVDSSVLGNVSEALGAVVTGQSIDPEDAEAIATQIQNNSQVSLTYGSYNKTENKYGAKVKVPLLGSFGGDYHTVEVNQNTAGGLYYNPVTGTWEENLACNN